MTSAVRPVKADLDQLRLGGAPDLDQVLAQEGCAIDASALAAASEDVAGAEERPRDGDRLRAPVIVIPPAAK